MSTVRIDALVAKYVRALPANASDTAFVAKAPQHATPTIHYDLAPHGNVGHGALMFQPFATGGNNAEFAMRVIGWRQFGSNKDTLMWIPAELYEVTCICGNLPGAAGMDLLDTEFLADTITLVFGNDNVSSELLSPENDQPAHCVVDFKGFRYLELLFDMGTSATGANALVAPF